MSKQYNRYQPIQADGDRRADHRKDDARVDRVTNASVRAGCDEFRIGLLRHRHSPVPAEIHPGPDSQHQPQQEDGHADALQPWAGNGLMPLESSDTQQQKNDENDTGPYSCEPGPSCLAGFDTDGRREPVEPESYPAGEDDNVGFGTFHDAAVSGSPGSAPSWSRAHRRSSASGRSAVTAAQEP
jgi:hypothetical protein